MWRLNIFKYMKKKYHSCEEYVCDDLFSVYTLRNEIRLQRI